jgi:hypothetical protein
MIDSYPLLDMSRRQFPVAQIDLQVTLRSATLDRFQSVIRQFPFGGE